MNALTISGLRLALPGAARPVLAGVDLTVAAGETVALVGESGSGKSLTARSALGLFPARAEVAGTVLVQGEDVLSLDAAGLRALRSGRASMIFQDPRAAINPVRRIGDFLTEGLRFTASGAEAPGRAVELVEAVGLTPDVLRRHPHELSGGMLQRIMIASALMTDPVLLLADEPTTALDVTTQAEVIAILAELRARFGTGLLFVTHDLGLAAAISDRVCVMYAGRIVESGPAMKLFGAPRHPYTSALLNATPSLETTGGRLPAIPGQPPDPRTALTGCAFAERCPLATDLCRTQDPPTDAGGAACHHPLEGEPHHV